MSIYTTDIPNPGLLEEPYTLIEQKPKKPSSALKSNSRPFTQIDDNQLNSHQIFFLDQVSSSPQYENAANYLEKMVNSLENQTVSDSNSKKAPSQYNKENIFPQEQSQGARQVYEWMGPQEIRQEPWENAGSNVGGNLHRSFRGSPFSRPKETIRRQLNFYNSKMTKDDATGPVREEVRAELSEPVGLGNVRRPYQCSGNKQKQFVLVRNLAANDKQFEDSRQGSTYKQTQNYKEGKDGLPEEVLLRIGQAPLQPLSAYQLFVKDKCVELKKAHVNLPQKEISRMANNCWLYELGADDKEAYKHKYAESMRYYNEKFAEYKARKKEVLNEYWRSLNDKKSTEEVKSNDEKVKFKTAYRLFKLDNVADVKTKYPETSFKERAQVIKEMWKNLSPHSKFLYMKRSRIDKQKALLEKKMNLVIQVQQKKSDPQEKDGSKKNESGKTDEKRGEISASDKSGKSQEDSA